MMTSDFALTNTAADTVNALACSPQFASDGTCFAARTSGLYRSVDGGDTWQFAYGSLALAAPLGATAVAVSPGFGRGRMVLAGAIGGALRSTDGGDTWQVVTLPDPAPLVTALAFSPGFATDGIAFAATMEDGVFRSEDGGRTWAAWNFGLTDRSVLALAVSPDFATDQTVIAGTDSGLFRSTNTGRSWRAIELPCGFAPVLSAAQMGDLILAGTEADGLYCSDDGGRNWQRIAADVLDGAINAIVLPPDFPISAKILLLLNDAPMLSEDGGQAWARWQNAGDGGISAISAPMGLGAGAPLLAGLHEGSIVRL